MRIEFLFHFAAHEEALLQKKTIRLAKETLLHLDLARGGAVAAPSWSGCPTISCISCTYDACCAQDAGADRLG